MFGLKALLAPLRERAQAFKRESLALLLATRDPRTPWLARILIVVVVAYALSPIDLIPDFIPVLGYLDDLVIVPVGFWLALRLVPPEVLAECRARAAEVTAKAKRLGVIAATMIVAFWLAVGVAIYLYWWR